MNSAISDLQKWRDLRKRELDLELEGLTPMGELGNPETEDDRPDNQLDEKVEDPLVDLEFRRADDKKVLYTLEGYSRDPHCYLSIYLSIRLNLFRGLCGLLEDVMWRGKGMGHRIVMISRWKRLMK